MTEASEPTAIVKLQKCAGYVAFGAPYLSMALVSAQTFKKYNPDCAVHIISNLPEEIRTDIAYWDENIDTWTEVQDTVQNNRKYKTNIASIIRADRVAYLDCDTLITGSLKNAFQYLEYFDIALRAHRGRQTHRFLATVPILENGLTVKELPHWNGGVVYYKRNTKTKEFFQDWQGNFDAMAIKYDQPTLAKTLIESDCRVLTLDERWNGGFKKLKDDRGGIPLVAHYHSAMDSTIETALRYYAKIISKHTSTDDSAEVEKYIFKCKKLRFKKAPLTSILRRFYRKTWHRKYGVIDIN